MLGLHRRWAASGPTHSAEGEEEVSPEEVGDEAPLSDLTGHDQNDLKCSSTDLGCKCTKTSVKATQDVSRMRTDRTYAGTLRLSESHRASPRSPV